MINRVYFFNRDIAKANKCEYSSVRSFLKYFGGILVYIIIIKIIQSSAVFKNDSYIAIGLLPIFMAYILFIHHLSVNGALAQIRAFYSDVFGNVYFLDNNNNGKTQFLIGSLVYSKLSRSKNKQKKALGNAAFVAGAVSAAQTIEEQTNFMRNPDNSAKLLEDSFSKKNVSGNRILKVYKIKEYNKKIKLICDYKQLYNGKIKRKKQITIYKVYTGLDELIELLKKRVVL